MIDDVFTNAEYQFLNDLMNGYDIIKDFAKKHDCSEIKLCENILKLLKEAEQNKNKFTADEKVILRNLPPQFNWIARNEDDGELSIFKNKPTKYKGSWSDLGETFSLPDFNHIFKGIRSTDEEPCNFKELLKYE